MHVIRPAAITTCVVSGLLMAAPATPSRAAEPAWVCEPDTSGQNWTCSQGGVPAPAPPKPAPTHEAAPLLPAREPETGFTAPATTAPEPQPAPPPVAAEPTPSRWIMVPVKPDSPWAVCGPYRIPSAAQRPEGVPLEVNRDVPAELVADHAETTEKQTSIFSGQVVLRRADQQIEAERVLYDKATGHVLAEGQVRYYEYGLAVEGSYADIELATDEGEIRDAQFYLVERHAHGGAETIYTQGQEITQAINATFTTCPPEKPDWVLGARRLTLYEQKGVGTARDVTMKFKDVPIFYAPYISFPIDDRRKSGFLLPTFATSQDTGFDLRVPYYWNIAPNQDATFTPRYMSERGILLGGEYRYLTSSSRGEVSLEYLPDDDKYGDDRASFSLKHRGSLIGNWSTDIALNNLSDEDYFRDLGNSLSIAATTHLERHADVRYQGDNWSLLGRVQSYQTLDQTLSANARPYERLPQVLFLGDWPHQFGGLTYGLRAEAVNFDRDDSVTGTRMDLKPTISLPYVKPGYFVTPTLSLEHTQYALSNQASAASDTPSRTLPLLSLDSGLFLERDTGWGDTKLLHTLEPRLYYLYVPSEDQTDIPVFDTGAFDFSFQQLFRDNRFNGADRIGDANQLTLAVTSRLLEQDGGREWLSASLGEIFYFDDREVTLPGQPAEDNNSSDIVAAMSVSPTRAWRARAELQWDPHDGQTDKGTVALHYQPDKERIINLSYRFRRDAQGDNDLEQTDLSALWPLSRHWRGVARWNYSLKDKRDLEVFGGLEYESCCWTVRLVRRIYVNDLDDASNYAWLLQLELKGLTSVGTPIEDLLERGILGYQAERP